MLAVTSLALNNLQAYLAQNKVSSAVRISTLGACGDSALGLSLDEIKDNDHIFEENGQQFLVDKTLLEQCGVIKVDFIEAGFRSGFSITSEHPVHTEAGSCGSACNGSCGSAGAV